MTLEAKISRFLKETRAQGIFGMSAAPPLLRLFWNFGWDVAPPYFWSFEQILVRNGAFFTAFIFLYDSFLTSNGYDWRRRLLGALIGGICFGLMVAWWTRRQSRRLRLSPWHESPQVPPVTAAE